MNPKPAPPDNGAIKEKPGLNGHANDGHAKKLYPPLIAI